MAENRAGRDVTGAMLTKYDRNFEREPVNRLAMNAVTRTNVQEIALNREALNALNFTFSHEVETGSVTDQARANTCWLFANLNWLRTITCNKINVKEFEFSENFLLFYDKLEKSNYFLENMIALSDRPVEDRLVTFMLDSPNPDGGEWHMTVNLVEKYGIVPKEVMPDTFNRTSTRFVNEILAYKLREGASRLRTLAHSGKTLKELRSVKQEIMNEIYRILVIFFGKPPQKFNWAYRDEDKKYHQELDITPREYYAKYVGLDLGDMYSLLSCPGKATPFNKTFTVDYFNNMHGKHRLFYLNVPIETLKKLAITSLKKGETCMFGCDVRYQTHSKEGFMDSELYDYETLLNTSFTLDKAARVEYLHVRLTHAMVLTGVDLVKNKPIKWKVENSWGDKVGKKGYFVMTDRWFDEYTYDLTLHKKYFTKKLLKGYEQDPTVLPPWHPLG